MATAKNSIRTVSATPSTFSGARTRNFGLDVIRATAIMLVIVSHYSTLSPACGVLGVELFFVLSGFLIGGILYRTIQNSDPITFQDFGCFWARRWMRTLPNYYFFLLFNVALAAATTRAVSLATLWRYPLFLQNFARRPLAFFEISWSLAVEEWFYLIFPLLFFGAYAVLNKRLVSKRTIFLSSAASMALFSFALRLWKGNLSDWSWEMRMVVIYRFDALMFGVFVAVIHAESSVWWQRMQLFLPVGLTVLTVGTAVAQRSLPSTQPLISAAWLLTILPLGCALVLPSATRLSTPYHFLSKPIQFVSQCSYSMYLCHIPILSFVLLIGHDGQQGFVGKALIRGAALALTLICSGMLFRYLEKPILALAPKDR